MTKIEPCEQCGNMTMGRLCEGCAKTEIRLTGTFHEKAIRVLEERSATELEVARFCLLPPAGQLMTAWVLEDPERELTVGETIGTCEQIARERREG